MWFKKSKKDTGGGSFTTTINDVTVLNVMFSSHKTEWGTPQKFFDKLDAMYHFTFDAAASHMNAKCDFYCTKDGFYVKTEGVPMLYTEADGLASSWHGHTVWCNPPYGRKETGLWVAKAIAESVNETKVCMLLPARTDTAWWHDYVERSAHHYEFIRGRLKFEGATSGAPFPSVLVFFGAW